MTIGIVLSIICGTLYRIGGSDLFLTNKTKYRDAGCPLVGCTLLAAHCWPLTGLAWFGLILSFGLSWGAMTTYFKKKDTDAEWYNWLFVALAFGIAFLPYAWATGQWGVLFLRTLILCLTLVPWCEIIGWDVGEEFGRGFLYCITLLIF